MPKTYAERILDQIRELVNQGIIEDPEPRDHGSRAAEEKAIFDSVFEDEAGPTDELHTSARVKELAAKGLRAPHKLDEKETQELCGSVMRHIQRHGG